MTRHRGIRRFFLGILGWTPQTLLHDATLLDLVDAAEGYGGKHGKRDLPASAFMQEMMTRHPDETEGTKT